MDVREKLVEQAISHFWYGVSHDIFSEPVTTYAKLAIEALKKENGVTVQEWISVNDRLPDNKEHDWVLAQIVEDNGYMHIPKVMEYRQSKNDWFEETYGWISDHNGAFLSHTGCRYQARRG